jgi:hypothetical protein
MVAVLQSVDELEALLKDRPDQSRTYKIDPGVVDEMIEFIRSHPSGANSRTMDPAEVEELARYLDVAVEDFPGRLTVTDIACSGCGRRLTILDIAKTGVDNGLHSRELMAAVLTGRAGQWVTVRGKDGGRFVDCAACGLESVTPIDDYACSPVAYAWA